MARRSVPARSGGRLVAVVIAAATAVACSSSPEIPTVDGTQDPELVAGRDVFSSRCAGCHGTSGGGGVGPALGAERLAERYPDPADLVDVVVGGRGGMPAWGDVLSAAEIDAVVRYITEVL